MKETHLCYCDICNEITNFNSALRHINSEADIHKKEYGIVVKEDEFIKPENHEVKYILNGTVKGCRNQMFSFI